MVNFYSHGKLLITGEYLVLDGAKALAVPTKFGQSLEVRANNDQKIVWKSIDHKGTIWSDVAFPLELNQALNSDQTSQRLLEIFNQIKDINPSLFKQGLAFISKIEFPQDWGLGSSSTLINNLASWAHIDPYLLLDKTFGGSGYDISCAQYDNAITYQLQNNERIIEEVKFAPEFSDHLYFVHLNQKQNSREGIAIYDAKKGDNASEISEINSITNTIIDCKDLSEFNLLIEKHEQIISEVIGLEPVKKRLFSDFEGSIKSLGAWGGDFVLASSFNNPIPYFQKKGYYTIIPFNDMIL